jgi:hypothetical protein
MVLPAELIGYSAPEKAELNLKTTFSSLSAQGWISLALILGGFLLMVFDAVGGECAAHVRSGGRADLKHLKTLLLLGTNHASSPPPHASQLTS